MLGFSSWRILCVCKASLIYKSSGSARKKLFCPLAKYFWYLTKVEKSKRKKNTYSCLRKAQPLIGRVGRENMAMGKSSCPGDDSKSMIPSRKGFVRCQFLHQIQRKMGISKFNRQCSRLPSWGRFRTFHWIENYYELKSLEVEVPGIKALFIAYNCIHLCESDPGFLHRAP